MTSFQTIDPSLLITATGGQAQQGPEETDRPPQRSWGQVAGQYGNACVQGAGQALLFGGRPRSWQQAAGTAAIGCATGVGMQALQDVGGMITGDR
jgi:hypothetical protein